MQIRRISMDCIILAAGYATRLYPLTLNNPKPLLKVRDKTILDWLVDDLEQSGEIDKYIVVSNSKFYENFVSWADEKEIKEKITVVDDGTSTNETRLGAVADILFAQKKLGLKADLMVIAGDNVLDFSLCKFIEYYKSKKASCIMRYYEENYERCKKSGVLECDDSDTIISMEEKPETPKTQWLAPPFYIYTKEDAMSIEEALNSGCGKDAPGSFPAWLCTKTKVYAMKMPGKRYDIGNMESYENVQKSYNEIINK